MCLRTCKYEYEFTCGCIAFCISTSLHLIFYNHLSQITYMSLYICTYGCANAVVLAHVIHRVYHEDIHMLCAMCKLTTIFVNIQSQCDAMNCHELTCIVFPYYFCMSMLGKAFGRLCLLFETPQHTARAHALYRKGDGPFRGENNARVACTHLQSSNVL